MQKPEKKITFKFFDYKWDKVPTWASDTEEIYRQWYLERYGHNTLDNLSLFLKDKKRILEAGCGLARDSKMFAELNPTVEIIAMDQSEQALKIARKTLDLYNNCKVVRDDITNFKIMGKFDFISCTNSCKGSANNFKHSFKNTEALSGGRRRLVKKF